MLNISNVKILVNLAPNGMSWFSLKTYFAIQNTVDLDCILDN